METCMKTVTVNLAFRKALLAQIDAEAKRESRSRSELIREAARQYVQRQRRWEQVFALADDIVERRGLTEADVRREISLARSARRARK
jgi:CopG family transcriptional regulator/antitoxin EndoAI